MSLVVCSYFFSIWHKTYWFLFMWMWVYMYESVCRCTGEKDQTHEGQRAALQVVPQKLFTCFSETRSLSWTRGSWRRLIWLGSQLWGSTGLHLLRDDSHENLHGLQSDCWSLADSLPCQGHHSMVTIRGSKQTGLSLYVTPQDQNKASHHRL